VVERLRALESRLDTLSGAPGFRIQPLRDAFALHEVNRGKQYAEALRQASGFALEIARSVNSQVELRLSGVADKAASVLLEKQFPATGRDHSRIAEQEEMLPGMLEQFAELRRSVEARGEKLDAALGRVDELWRQQDATGHGGWRVVMRAVGERVEFEKNQQPAFTDQYRGDIAGEVLPPAVPGLKCARCGSASVRRVRRETMLEEALRLGFIAPYRCSVCGERSFHFR